MSGAGGGRAPVCKSNWFRLSLVICPSKPPYDIFFNPTDFTSWDVSYGNHLYVNKGGGTERFSAALSILGKV